MRRAFLVGLALPAFAFGLLVSSTSAHAQDASPANQSTQKMSRTDIISFAKIQLAIDTVRDSVQFAFPITGNKKTDAQSALQEKLRKDVEEILHHNGLTEAEYQRKVYMVSTDNETRKTYDSVIVALTGVPLPGAVQANAGRGGGRGGAAAIAPVAVPAGAVGTHIGHIMNAFTDTPNMGGLLRMATAEAGVAIQHAGLGARTPDDLAMMKTHAGHILHALDPSTVPTLMAPGAGYGVKKASAGVLAHIELAAAVDGASANVKTHSGHVATSSKNTSKRVDQLIAMAQKVQAATTAAEAAALFSQMVPLSQQLMAGFDTNSDGRITWEEGEGGLQQAEEHVTLLLRGEGSSQR